MAEQIRSKKVAEILGQDPMLRILVDAPVNPITGLKYITNEQARLLLPEPDSMYMRREIDGHMLRIGFWNTYNPGVDTYTVPYCHENEQKWRSYCNEKGLVMPTYNTVVCEVKFRQGNQICEINPIARQDILLKDPFGADYGEETGYTKHSGGYVTTPLIIAMTENNEPIYLSICDRITFDSLPEIFPTTYVGIVRPSDLDARYKNTLGVILQTRQNRQSFGDEEG